MLLYTDNVDAFSEEELENALYRMPAERRSRIEKRKFERDRRNSIIAWILLERVIPNINQYTYRVDDNGKPYFENCDIKFSISHTDDAVAVAWDSCDIGVDIQKYPEDYIGPMRVVCTDDEKRGINSSKDFTRVWCIKEATVKCLGTGIADMKNVDTTKSYNDFDYHIEQYKNGIIVECKKRVE